MSTFLKQNKTPVEDLAPGLKRQIIGYQDNIMLVKVFFDASVHAPLHTHPHEQISHVLTGKFEITIENEKQTLIAGDSFTVSPNAPHSATCIQTGVLLDAFSPKRDDFLK